jgi:hypothetical protein
MAPSPILSLSYQYGTLKNSAALEPKDASNRHKDPHSYQNSLLQKHVKKQQLKHHDRETIYSRGASGIFVSFFFADALFFF